MPKLYIRNKYGIVPNELLNNPNVSLRAKGLFAFLQSKPDGWQFSKERIANQTKDGKDAIKRALQELEKLGYLARKPTRNKKGLWVGYDYELADYPSAENPSTDNPSTDNPVALSNKDISNKDISNKDILGVYQKKYSSLKDLKPEDLREISEKYRVSLGYVNLQLEKMTNWLEAKGKCYKNYKRALMNWVLGDIEKQIGRRQGDPTKRGVDLSHLG